MYVKRIWVLSIVTQEANRSVELEFVERDESIEWKASRTLSHDG